MPPLNSACTTKERTYPTGARVALEMAMSRSIESLGEAAGGLHNQTDLFWVHFCRKPRVLRKVAQALGSSIPDCCISATTNFNNPC
jgi:hypothetical protein